MWHLINTPTSIIQRLSPVSMLTACAYVALTVPSLPSGALAPFVLQNPVFRFHGGTFPCPDLHPIPRSLQKLSYQYLTSAHHIFVLLGFGGRRRSPAEGVFHVSRIDEDERQTDGIVAHPHMEIRPAGVDESRNDIPSSAPCPFQNK